MIALSDKLIIDYLAGRLDPLEARVIDDAVVRDPEIRERVATLEAVHGRTETAAPRPGAALAAPHPSARMPASDHPAPAWRGRSIARMVGAAALLLAGGALLASPDHGLGWAGTGDDPLAVAGGAIVARGQLHLALDTLPDGAHASGKSTQSTPIATFLDRRQRICRDYAMVTAAFREFNGIACRSNGRDWQVLVHVQVGRHGKSPSTFSPAAAGDGELVTMASDGMRTGPSLPPAEVERLINSRWKRP